MRKSDAVRKLVCEQKFRDALAIARRFRIGISEEERTQMSRAYECMTYPAFYLAIGKDLQVEIQKGIDVLVRKYGKEVA